MLRVHFSGSRDEDVMMVHSSIGEYIVEHISAAQWDHNVLHEEDIVILWHVALYSHLVKCFRNGNIMINGLLGVK